MTWHLKADKRRNADIVDELVMRNATVHLEDLGDAYMLIVENADQHIHVTIPARRHDKAFVFEQFTPARTQRSEGESR